MKSLLFLVPLAALILAPDAAVATPFAPSIEGGMQARGLDTIPRGDLATYKPGLERVHALLELRKEGLRLQAEDGGTLTPQHRAYLQAKLDAIQKRGTN
ncbi:MAG: hypothetical protein KGJ79_04735 [Alphaproteobacteria bacterium]|nr:hypothetical protein [Alphaproteobacteria bacterium]MDE2110428.1 hypothetical protein [Alphaproteobacteria bacterium]MDE2493413.1 hypothetical protein [Alphaproteobacteria bacterium]